MKNDEANQELGQHKSKYRDLLNKKRQGEKSSKTHPGVRSKTPVGQSVGNLQRMHRRKSGDR
jgi:hypothetical protein